MAQLLKCSAGLVRIPLAASWKPCTKVIMRTEHSANSFLPKSHSLACISTSTKFYKNPSRYKDSKKAIQEDSKGHEIKTVKEKHIQILIAITDHDLEIKLKKICSWLVKGYSVKIKILTSFKNPDKSEKNSQAILQKLTTAVAEHGKVPVPQDIKTGIYIGDFKDIPIKTDK